MVSISCPDGPGPWRGSRLRFVLDEDAEQTLVTLEHSSDTASEDDFLYFNTKWPAVSVESARSYRDWRRQAIAERHSDLRRRYGAQQHAVVTRNGCVASSVSLDDGGMMHDWSSPGIVCGMTIEVRSITSDEVPAFHKALARGFGNDAREEDEARFRGVHEIPRTVAAFDGGEIVGTGSAFSFEMTIPGGGQLPLAGTTIITVQPTHRRRGVLTAMMRHHLDEVQSRGEPLAGLWASESSIYGRFGYGMAAEGFDTRIDSRSIVFRDPSPAGKIRLVDPQQALSQLRDVYERVRSTRPGMMTRSERWWTWRVLGDPEHWRKGKSAKRFAICEGPDGIDGYVIYRQQEKWDDFPDGTVHVVEVMAATAEAHQTIWTFLTRIDLFPNVAYWNLPVDDHLPWLINDGRRVVRTITDSLWVRLMDIPRALAARAYTCSGSLVLKVDDPFLPDNSGCYELTVAAGSGSESGGVAESGGGRCVRTDVPPDITLGVDTLGAMFLGTHRCSVLARAGHVAGKADAIARADALFAWPTASWCPEVF